jgi:hypothetical protein
VFFDADQLEIIEIRTEHRYKGHQNGIVVERDAKAVSSSSAEEIMDRSLRSA